MMTSAAVGDNLLNDKNTIAPDNKDRTNKKDLMKKFKAARKAKKKGSKTHNNYLSALDPNKKQTTARDILIRTGQIKESDEPFDRLSLDMLKKMKKPLSATEKAKIIKSKAVWDGKPAIWKAVDKTGNKYYIITTQRKTSVNGSLQSAIRAFHRDIKGKV